MNEAHLQFLASPVWAQMLETDLLPWIITVADLGDDVLEIGPGPGLTTDLLRQRVSKLTVIELDAELAAALVARLSGTNVDVIQADATHSGLGSGRFSAATCFSMLHHMPQAGDQDRLFARVVPGASSCRILHRDRFDRHRAHPAVPRGRRLRARRPGRPRGTARSGRLHERPCRDRRLSGSLRRNETLSPMSVGLRYRLFPSCFSSSRARSTASPGPKSSSSNSCRSSTSPSSNGTRFAHSIASPFDFTSMSQ